MVLVSGFARSAGKVKVNVAVQPYNAGWTPIAFVQLRYLQDDTGWVRFSKEVVLPDGTARFGLVLLIDGDGRAWLDEVTCEVVE